MKKARAVTRRGLHLESCRTLDRQDVDDLKRIRVDDQELIADDDVVKAAIFRNDCHNVDRQYLEMDAARNGSADRDVEVDVVDSRNVTVLDDDVFDPCALRVG